MTSRRGDARLSRLEAQGVQLPPDAIPTETPITWENFVGYHNSDADANVPEGTSNDCLDVEVTRQGRLRRAAGVGLREILPYSPTEVIVHASLDYTAELLFIAAPKLGIKSAGPTVWINAGLPVGAGWTSVVYGDRLIFTNGSDAVWARPSNSLLAPEALTASPCHALFVLGTRLFLCNAVVDGNFQPLAVLWNAASALYNDFSGEGAGFELLIADVGQGDEIVAATAMSFDMAVIFGRSSIWRAVRTDDPYRPANFELRERGIGCVARNTVKVTQDGVVFLSEAGLELFDGSRTTHLSTPIDKDLLPLDLSQLDEYSGCYNPATRRYELLTPVGSWVIDFARGGAWYRKSLVARRSFIFAVQNPALTIGQLTQPIGSYTNIIEDWKGSQGAIRVLYLRDNELGEEDYNLTTYYNVDQNAYWTTRRKAAALGDTVLSYHGAVLTYQGLAGVEILLPNINSAFTLVREAELPDSSVLTAARVSFLSSGLEPAVRLRIAYGNPEFSRIQLMGRPESPSMLGV